MWFHTQYGESFNIDKILSIEWNNQHDGGGKGEALWELNTIVIFDNGRTTELFAGDRELLARLLGFDYKLVNCRLAHNEIVIVNKTIQESHVN